MAQMNWAFPYASRRVPVLARNVVASSQPLAAQAGLRMLLKGGSAADAVLATAIALTVVEPTMNGMGSDAFALVWDGKHLNGLNASGRSPLAWSPDRFRGRTSMPSEGWDAVTVPGAVSAWAALSSRCGRLPFAQLFEPAIEYATRGFTVSPTVALQWQAQTPRLRDQPGFAAAFLPGGRPPHAGELFRFPAQAETLREIASSGGESFYRGNLAARIAQAAKGGGAALTAADLSAHRADWVEPIAQTYRDATLHEIPPNGQGLAALMALGILGHFELGAVAPDSADSFHLQIEAMKLAFADVYRYVTDPASMEISANRLLDRDYLAGRAKLIDRSQSRTVAHGVPPAADTVYLTAADAQGMMISYIQSNYMGFGSGVVVPDTGISLQNRGAGFSLKADHPNVVAGGKRPFHTIIPAFLSRSGRPLMSFGVMGGDMQPQGHVQMTVRLLDYGQNPQAAADAPRWKIIRDGGVILEQAVPEATAAELARRGHRVARAAPDSMEFGAAQLILCLEDGYAAASEPRRDGQAVGF